MRLASNALIILCCTFLLSCSKHSSKATAPDSAIVHMERVPFRADIGTIAIGIAPIEFDEIAIQNGKISEERYTQPQAMLNAIFLTALTNIKNFKVIDPTMVRLRRGKYQMPSKRTDKGPFVVRATITEYDGFLTVEGGGFNPNPERGDGAAEMLLKLPAMTAAFWVSQLTTMPTKYKWNEITGAVALDIDIIDARSGRLVDSFPVHASFKQRKEEIGQQYGGGWFYSKQAESILSQAIRKAFSEAAVKVFEKVSTF